MKGSKIHRDRLGFTGKFLYEQKDLFAYGRGEGEVFIDAKTD